MATFVLTLTDDEATGQVTVEGNYGDAYVPDSQAHGMGEALLNSILANANHYTEIEDTAPESQVEPSRIITTDNPTPN